MLSFSFILYNNNYVYGLYMHTHNDTCTCIITAHTIIYMKRVLLFSCFRYLVPRPLGSTDSIHAFLTSIAHDTMLSYWKDFETRLDKTNLPEGEGRDEVGGGRPSQLPPQHLSSVSISDY